MPDYETAGEFATIEQVYTRAIFDLDFLNKLLFNPRTACADAGMPLQENDMTDLIKILTEPREFKEDGQFGLRYMNSVVSFMRGDTPNDPPKWPPPPPWRMTV